MMENDLFCELMCRACLGTGRLYSIYDYKLSESYSQLTGTKVHPQDGLPQHLCVTCSSQLAKHAELKSQCLKSLVILDGIKKKHSVITRNSVAEELKLTPTRYSRSITSFTQYPPSSFDEDIIKDHREPFEYHSEVKAIKTEVFIDNFSMKVDENSTDSYSSQLYIDELQVNDDGNQIDTPKTDAKDGTTVDESKDGEKVGKTKKRRKNFYKELDQEDKIEKKKRKSKKVREGDTEVKHRTRKVKNDTEPKKVKKIKIKLPQIETKNNNEVQEQELEEQNKELENEEQKIDSEDTKFKKRKYQGKFFENRENMTGFESLYEVEVLVLTKEQQHSDVLERKMSHNYLNSPFRCQYCFKGFIDEENLTKHYKSQHDPSRGTVTCEFCQFRYRDKRGLNQHLKTHRLKFICRQCKYVSRTTYNAKEHFKMHRGMMHECKECGKAYEKLSTYLTHMRVHHPAELSWCELCAEPFVGQFGLNGHKTKAHADLKFPPEAKCPCGAHFTNLEALQHHASDPGYCEQTPCLHCGASFSSRVELKTHLDAEHREKKSYSCGKCSKTFRSESLYTGHYRRMHSVRRAVAPWVCEICGKVLPNRSRLIYHQRVHTGDKPYQCTQCPKKFSMSKLLRSHSRVHSNERPFACKRCPKTFKGPSALRTHEYMHDGEKKIRTRSIVSNEEPSTV